MVIYKKTNKYRAVITIGNFETPELAAEAYNKFAYNYYGEFSKPNIIK
jgi:hypothetical protein